MDRHLQERQIDLLLLAPERLEPGQREEFESHVSSCASCKALVSFLRDVYQELKNHSSEPDGRVEALVNQILGQDRIIDLIPFRFVPATAEFGEKKTTVLAAHSDQKNEFQYSSVCTLISRDERSLVRVLRDNEHQRYRLFLVTTERPAASRASVYFPRLGLSVTLPEDATQADVHLPSGIRDVDWTTLSAELRFAQD